MRVLVGDFWENFEDRPLTPVFDYLRAEERQRGCGEWLELGPIRYACTRPPDHHGRHVGRAVVRICAAWPGALPPILEDLL
jgi:hypothetical protein